MSDDKARQEQEARDIVASWAERIAADVYDVPAIETREEFRGAIAVALGLVVLPLIQQRDEARAQAEQHRLANEASCAAYSEALGASARLRQERGTALLLGEKLAKALEQIASREPWCATHRQFIGKCSIALGTSHTMRIDPEPLIEIARAALSEWRAAHPAEVEG